MVQECMKKSEDESSSSSEVADGDINTDVGNGNSLPKMVLRVLLVESDDSTRRLISALLRKCGYKGVVAVSDGLKAWEMLKARPQNFDLVLTEVDLPSISGFALLTLIMEDDICKNIPVIMISSQDSINVVLKCMLRGAADFLTKPIRRNELRNLWQHVWRRQTKTERYVLQSTAAAKHEVASCENKTVKDLSSSKMSDKDGKEEGVQLIVKSGLPTREVGGKPSRSGPEVVSLEETLKSTVSSLEECSRPLSSGTSECSESDREHDNVIGEIYGCTRELIEPSSAIDYISKFEDYPENVNGCYSPKSGEGKLSLSPSLELSLRKTYVNGSKDEGMTEQQTHNYTNGSAFSWYDNSKTLQSLSPAMDGSCGDGVVLSLSDSHEDLITAVVSRHKQAEAAVPGLSLDTVWPRYIRHDLYAKSDLVPVSSQNSNGRCDLSSSPLNWSLCPGSENLNDSTMISDNTVQEDDNVSGPVKDNISGMAESERDSPFVDLSAASSSFSGAVDKLNSSVSGSICSTVDDSNSNPSASVAKSLGTGSLSYSHTGVTCMDSHSASQREAALQKFRLKRKNRCFDKKVRYQSRKRLAEQRPRVKGQFVRQVQVLADC